MRWVLSLVVALSVSCSSVPLKQKAVTGLQVSETALEGAHDMERNLCSPTANKAQPIRHCDGPLALSFGLTDAVHQQLAVVFARAFDVQGKAAVVLRSWRAGDPAPASFLAYQQDIAEILGVIQRLQMGPAVAPIVTKAQAAVDEAGRVAAILGVK